MNISGIGFYMNTINPAAMSHYDKLNQGFGNSDTSVATPQEQKKDVFGAIPAAKLELSVNGTGAGVSVKPDKELEEYSTFVGAPERVATDRYSEDWMRPVENFAL